MSFNFCRKLREARLRKALRLAVVRRLHAFAVVSDAVARGDDRDLGRARMELQEATNQEMMAARELSRSASARTPKSARPIAALTFQGRG